MLRRWFGRKKKKSKKEDEENGHVQIVEIPDESDYSSSDDCPAPVTVNRIPQQQDRGSAEPHAHPAPTLQARPFAQRFESPPTQRGLRANLLSAIRVQSTRTQDTDSSVEPDIFSSDFDEGGHKNTPQAVVKKEKKVSVCVCVCVCVCVSVSECLV
jgi:hypothetical protein